MQVEGEECIILFEEPSTHREAACEEAWNRAMKEEMEAIDQSQTLELVAPPPPELQANRTQVDIQIEEISQRRDFEA